MPRKPATPAPMFGDASDLPLFSGTPAEPRQRARPGAAPSPARPAPAPQLPGMPEPAPEYVTVNGYQVRASLARGASLGGRSPHIVHHGADWTPSDADNPGDSRRDTAFDGWVTPVSVTTTRARELERDPAVRLCRPA